MSRQDRGRGGRLRFLVPYEDPKIFDGTSRGTLEYDERCRQMSGEILYLISLVELG